MRLGPQQWTCVAIVVCLLATGLAAQADPGPLDSLPRETIIGFHAGRMPDVREGDSYAGFNVVQVVPKGLFIVVDAAEPNLVLPRLPDPDTVAYVEPNVALHGLFEPNDPRYGDQWGPGPMGFETAWEDTLGSSDIVVAVIDSGIRRTHVDFDDARVLQGWDYVSNDNDPDDTCGHGTHVGGTIAATTNNGVGVAGMSQATILPYKVLSALLLDCSGSTSNVAAAILDAADAGARIISMSIGGGGSTTLQNAVDSAWDDGVLVVAAAGNNNGGSVDFPAAYANVIAVSALDSDLTIASYSSIGPQVDVAAPGTGVLSTYDGSDTSYASLSGTSMAAPHVSGALALALGEAPETTAQAARDALEATAQDLGAPGWDQTFGHGLVRVDLLLDELYVPPPPPPGNEPPAATFDATVAGLRLDVNATASTDPDGDAVEFDWDFGDGATATGAVAGHWYETGGNFTVTLRVSDPYGQIGTATAAVEVVAPPDPDPSTPNIADNVPVTLSLAAGQEAHYKIDVREVPDLLVGQIDGPDCILPLHPALCAVNADLYLRRGARATDTSFDCRPQEADADETCNRPDARAGLWYLRVKMVSGSADITLSAIVVE